MNFSIHIDDQTGKKLNQLAKKRGKARNALINEAIRNLIEKNSHSQWSAGAKRLAGAMPDLEPFENHRRDLIEQDRNPFE